MDSGRNDQMENTADIAAVAPIIRKSKHSDCNDRKDRCDRAWPAILPIPAIIWKSITSDHMETEGGLYFGKGSEKFNTLSHSNFGITF